MGVENSSTVWQAGVLELVVWFYESQMTEMHGYLFLKAV